MKAIVIGSAFIILAALLVCALVLSLGWPLWVGFFLLLGLVGCAIALILIKRIWSKKREHLFVQRIIEQDESSFKGLAEKERDHIRQLQDRWKESIEALKKSHLRKHGNPLYVLPWYLVIGESGSGKTTAIKSARISSSFAEVNQVSGIAGTKNCDWWFFEQAIIIDAAGRYAIPVDEGRDKEEWQRFIHLLSKYRKREPLNGLIVTVAADKLLEANPEALQEDGREIRRRLSELTRIMGAKPPVYVLITKCDLIQGMAQFCEHLPEESLNQAMGCINRDLSGDVNGFFERSFDTIGDRLKDFRLILLNQSENPGADPGLLLFPEELQSIKAGLATFIKEAFQENPYQEPQILRGLFLSSGRQEGSPYSHLLKAMGLIEEKDVLAGTSKGLFLHDFFSRILPRDRNLFAPTQLALEWKRITRSLALTSWIVLWIALCGLLSFSFSRNIRILQEFRKKFSQLPVLQGKLLSDVVIMDHFREEICKVEDRNRRQWLPNFGLDEGERFEMKLKERYSGMFQKDILSSLDEHLREQMALFPENMSQDALGEYVAHCTRRINLLKQCLEGDNFETLIAMPQPDYASFIARDDVRIIEEINEKFSKLYLSYLIWRPQESDIRHQIQDSQQWLKHLLTHKESDLHWLVPWADRQESLARIGMEEFWGVSDSPGNKRQIAPSYTRAGKEKIDSFLKEIEGALPDPGRPLIAGKILEFQDWYRAGYLHIWRDFADSFHEGLNGMKRRDEWQREAVKMPTDQGPHFHLLDRIASEVKPFLPEDELPSWAQLILQLHAMKEKDNGLIAKTAQKGRQLLNKVSDEVTLDLKGPKVYGEYRKALSELVNASNSQNLAYQAASTVYQEDAAISAHPFHVAHRALLELRNLMGNKGKDDEIVWKVLEGPLNFLWALTQRETACSLQNKWDEMVLAEIQGASGSSGIYQVVGEGGHAWKFVKGPAAPFISWSRRKGYYAKKILDESIPFEESFLSFLTKGGSLQHTATRNYKVVIEGKPTSANRAAQVQPDTTTLELICVDGTQRLVNYNFYCKETFHWSSDQCDEVALYIKVGGVQIIKKYRGQYAFPKFLDDFKGGKRTFFPKEFPRQAETMKHLGIEYIDVQYGFSHHKPVLALLKSPSRVPKDIVQCWEN